MVTSNEALPTRAGIAIRMLGRFEVFRDGEPVPEEAWGRHKTLGLLKILLLSRGRVLTKDELIEALYGGEDPQKKVRNLQGRVSELRRALEPNLDSGAKSRYVLRIGGGYCFSDTAHCWLDTEAFLEHVKDGRHSQEEHRWHSAAESYEMAAELYRGDLLETDRYEEWVEPSRRTLRRRYIDSMLEQATCYEQLGRLRQSISCCQQVLEKEPHHETAIIRLVQYQAQAGHRDAALETYREGSRVLREYLDVEPSAELEAVREELVGPASSGAEDLDPRRIAVLPLQNYSPDAADEHLAHGMTEELISSLARVRDFRVIARTSVMRFKDSSQSVSQIARILGVGSIVEGSVRKVGDQLRVAAQLIDARTEEHLWADEYDGHISDALSMQKATAREVANALQVQLTRDETKALAPQRTGNVEAHTLYLKGRYLLWQGSADSTQLGMSYLAKAVELDPSHAHAHAALADAYALGSELVMSVDEAHGKAKEAVRRALEIDDTLPDAYSALGLIEAHIEHDAVTGKQNLDRAIQLCPSFAMAHTWQGFRYMKIGQYEQAIASYRSAIALDPLSPYQHWCLSRVLVKLNRFDEAFASLERALEINPVHESSMVWRVRLHHLLGNWDDAESAIEELRCVHGHLPRVYECLGWHHLYLGKLEESRAALEHACSLMPTEASFTHQYELGLAVNLISAWQFEQALEQIEPLLALNPLSLGSFRRHWPLFHMAIACEQLGGYDRALSLLDEASDLLFAEKTGESIWVPAGESEMGIWLPAAIGMVNAAMGNEEDASAALDGLRACPRNRGGQSARAVLCFRMGLVDEGFEALDLAIENHDWFIQTIKTHPWFDPVRDDPRFTSALERMNLAD